MSFSKSVTLFSLSLLSMLVVHGQQVGRKIKELKSAEVSYATVDRLGNFFIVSKNNQIKKFDPQGKVLATSKGKNATVLEPWYHPSIFLYDSKKQKYWIYGRYFENGKEHMLEPSWAIQPILACPSNDNKLWLFDAADVSMKKVNPITKEVLFEFYGDTTKPSVPSVYTHLREYQNMVFLLDQLSGISIYSHIGKKIRKISKLGINNFNFFGEELYYLDGSKIKFFDLGTGEVREIEVGEGYTFALATDESIVLVTQNNRIRLFENKINQ